MEPVTFDLGLTHSAVITRSGELFTGGSKQDGQLGVNFDELDQGSFLFSCNESD